MREPSGFRSFVLDRVVPHAHARFSEHGRPAAEKHDPQPARGDGRGLVVGGLAFAAGAMLYVIVDELVPESHARGNEDQATVGLLVGFTLMLVLDNAFG